MVDKKTRLEVTNWHAQYATDRQVVGPRQYRASAWGGLIGSVLIHGILLASLWLDLVNAATRLVSPVPLASVMPAPAEAQDLILVSGAHGNSREHRQFTMNDTGSGLKRVGALMTAPAIDIQVPRIDLPTELSEPQPSPEFMSSTEGLPSREHLLGIYSGQIRARVERIWRRPRTPIDDARTVDPNSPQDQSFHCRVTIAQDAMGEVLDTRLVYCNGSIAWQQSLIRAIHQASPLPSAPDPSVFDSVVTLDFIGFAWSIGMEPEDYELPNHEVAQATSVIR